MVFTDAFERTIDAKNRIQIPAELRRGLGGGEDGEVFYLCPGERHNTLSLYPERTFYARAEQLRTEEIYGEDPLTFEQLYFSLAARLDVDKQGRVVLPDRQLSLVNLGKDITLAGASTRIDIWKTSEYAEFLKEAFVSRWGELQRFMRQTLARHSGAPPKQ